MSCEPTVNQARQGPVLRCIAFGVLCLALSLPAQALQDAASPNASPESRVDPALYQVQLPVSSQEKRERDGALARGLMQVVIRITGRSDAAKNPLIQRALRDTTPLVLSSEYQNRRIESAGIATVRQELIVSYSPEAVNLLVSAAGLAIWNSPRAKPLLWLVINDGSGPRLVTAQQINVVRPLAERGLDRGIRLLLPSGTSTEQRAAEAIWSQDLAAVQVLNSRYTANTALLGKMSRAGNAWNVEWLLMRDDTEMARWNFSDLDPQRVIASGADDAAEAIAQRDAVLRFVGAPEQIQVQIGELNDQDQFSRVMGYLQSQVVINQLRVVQAQGNSLTLELNLAISAEEFANLMADGKVLRPGDQLSGDSPYIFHVVP